jgi:hypothetical protein
MNIPYVGAVLNSLAVLNMTQLTDLVKLTNLTYWLNLTAALGIPYVSDVANMTLQMATSLNVTNVTDLM